MAIFNGKRDLDLPLLTQLYQLENTDLEKPAGDTLAFVERLEPEFLRKWKEEEGIIFLLKDVDWKRRVRLDYWELLVFIKLLKPIMDANADKTIIDIKVLQEFNREFAYRISRRELHPSPNGGVMRGEEMSNASALESIVRQGVFDLFLSIESNRDFSRCAECKSVFVKTHIDAQYCSQRCRDRITQRNKRSRDISNTNNLEGIHTESI